MSLSLLLSLQVVSLGPPLPVQGRVIARAEPGVPLPLSRIRRVLRRCPGKDSTWKRPLEIRLVSAATLSQFKPSRADHARRGRYLIGSPKSPAIIYLAQGADLDLSLLHEWLHHQDAIAGKHRSEAAIEAEAKRCAMERPPDK